MRQPKKISIHNSSAASPAEIATLVAIIGRCIPARAGMRFSPRDIIVVGERCSRDEMMGLWDQHLRVFTPAKCRGGWLEFNGLQPIYGEMDPWAEEPPILRCRRKMIFHPPVGRARSIGRLASGQLVYNFARRCPRGLYEPAKLALALTAAAGRESVVVVVDLRDFRLSGVSHLVEAREGEVPIVARPVGRELRLPLLPHRKPKRTSKFSLVLRRIGDAYCIVDAHWGPLTPPVPWDRAATVESREFWKRHGLALPVAQKVAN